MTRYLISSYHEIYRDDYNEGESDRVNEYDLDQIVTADTPMEALETYYRDTLNRKFPNPEYLMLDDEKANVIYDSSLEDEDGFQPSESEIAEWKEGKRMLYANNATIHVNEIVPVDLTEFIEH